MRALLCFSRKQKLMWNLELFTSGLCISVEIHELFTISHKFGRQSLISYYKCYGGINHFQTHPMDKGGKLSELVGPPIFSAFQVYLGKLQYIATT